jgi:hypothetical protein
MHDYFQYLSSSEKHEQQLFTTSEEESEDPIQGRHKIKGFSFYQENLINSLSSDVKVS